MTPWTPSERAAIDAKKRGMDTPTSKTKRAALRARGWNVEIHET